MENNVFKLTFNKDNGIFPPEQVFNNPDWEFLITIGGDLSEDFEFEPFMTFLRKKGESKFTILENIGATQTERNDPQRIELSTSISWNEYKMAVSEIDPHFGLSINHYFVFGSRNDWGIYIAELPTVNIIGCSNSLLQNFQEIFNISGNGFKEVKDFISQEFQYSSAALNQFKTNYRFH